MLADTQDEPNSKTTSQRLPKWTIRGSDFGLFAAMLFSCMALGSAVFARIGEWLLPPASDDQPQLLISLAANFGMQFGMLAAYLGFIKIVQPRLSEPAPAKEFSLQKSVKIGLKWLLIAYPIMIAVNLVGRTVLDSFGFEQVIQDPIVMVQEGGSAIELAFMYTMIVLIAPICEEVAFRGAIFRYLHLRLPLYASLGVSAFFFAILHANLYSFAPLMTIGVMLALAYRESGSLISCMVFHGTFNTLNLLLILLFPNLT